MPALIFDFDGLMVDSERVIADAVLEALHNLGGHVALEDIAHLFGSTDNDSLWDALIRDLGLDVTLADIDGQLMTTVPPRIDELPLLPGVAELIDTASASGWPLGLGTGQEQRRLEEHLARLGLARRFDAVVTTKEVGRGKPAPDIFLTVAERLGVETTDCWVLEDSLPGCQAALAAGMNVIVCPSRVSASCAFPAGVERVDSLRHVRLDNMNRKLVVAAE